MKMCLGNSSYCDNDCEGCNYYEEVEQCHLFGGHCNCGGCDLEEASGSGCAYNV